jgi:hypothetical protein
MDNTIFVALLSVMGTVAGSLIGVAKAAKMTQYRLEKLEEREVQRTQLAERVIVLEQMLHSIDFRMSRLESDLKFMRKQVENKSEKKCE